MSRRARFNIIKIVVVLFAGMLSACSELHSTYNGQWGVTITHNPTGTTQTVNYLRAF